MVESNDQIAAANARKQDYMMEHIINKGYDAQDFTNFMWYQKEEGGNDVNNFTYDEILQLVIDFTHRADQIQKFGQPQNLEMPGVPGINRRPTVGKAPQPAALRDEHEEEKNLGDLVSGSVGPSNITPKLIQDQRNWADNAVNQQNGVGKEEKISTIQKRATNFFTASMVQDAEITAAQKESARRGSEQKTQIINTMGTQAAATAAAGASPVKMQASVRPQTNSRHQGAVRILFEQSVATKQLTPTRLSTIEGSIVEVNVTDGLMQQKGGFLSKKNWLSFKVRIPHIRSEVRRKDEEFDLLQEYLIKAYPNVIVPTTKPYKGQKYNEQKYMTKRAVYLSRFLANILRSRILRGDQFLMSFLTEIDDGKYTGEKTTMLKQKKVILIEDIVTPEGRIDLSIADVDKIRQELSQKVTKVSSQTENGYIYLHQQMRRLAGDMSVAAQTAENIRDTFGSLHKTSYELQDSGSAESESDQQTRFFYQTTREVFSKWAHQMSEQSTQIMDQQAKFFQHYASQGERIGALTGDLMALDKQHQQMQAAYAEKQRILFSKKDPSKWENPEVARMTKVDQDELLKDPNSAQLISPGDQAAMWKVRQTHAALIQSQLYELQTNQSWAVYDMRSNFTDLIQFMKQSAVDQSQIWSEYEQKLNPYQTQ